MCWNVISTMHRQEYFYRGKFSGCQITCQIFILKEVDNIFYALHESDNGRIWYNEFLSGHLEHTCTFRHSKMHVRLIKNICIVSPKLKNKILFVYNGITKWFMKLWSLSKMSRDEWCQSFVVFKIYAVCVSACFAVGH